MFLVSVQNNSAYRHCVQCVRNFNPVPVLEDQQGGKPRLRNPKKGGFFTLNVFLETDISNKI